MRAKKDSTPVPTVKKIPALLEPSSTTTTSSVPKKRENRIGSKVMEMAEMGRCIHLPSLSLPSQDSLMVIMRFFKKTICLVLIVE